MPRTETEIRRRRDLALADAHVRSAVQGIEAASKLMVGTGFTADRLVGVSLAHQGDNIRATSAQIADIHKRMDGGAS